MSNQPKEATASKSDIHSDEASDTNSSTKSLFDYDVLPDRPNRNLPKKMPKPHRCNSHMEDIFQGMFHEPKEFLDPLKRWVECVMSKEGEEPERWKLKNGRNF